jgi:hypothetical protein
MKNCILYFFQQKIRFGSEKRGAKPVLLYATQQLQCKPTFLAGMLKGFFWNMKK